MNINLINFEDNFNNYRLLYEWCSQEHVYTWFEQRILLYEEIINKYQNKIKDKKQKLYIIEYNNIKIGLAQIYKYEHDIELKDLKEYKNIYEYDLFIGNKEYLNKGIGTKIVNIVNKLIYSKYHADAIVLRPFKRNVRAIKCYQKCNFNILYEYTDKDTIGNKEDIIFLINNK